MDQTPLTRRQPKNVLAARQRRALRTRLYRWIARDTWTLLEAYKITYGIRPGLIPDAIDPRPDPEDLQDHAIRAVRAGKLKVGNVGDANPDWSVMPYDFAQWVSSRPDLVGNERAELFREWFPEKAAQNLSANLRQSVLESQYSTELFEMLLAVINEFWIPWQGGVRKNWPKEDEIKGWLKQRFPNYDFSIRSLDSLTSIARMERGSRSE